MHIVCDYCVIQRSVICFTTLHTFLKICPRTCYPTVYLVKSHYISVKIVIVTHTMHGFNKDIDTFVSELISSTRRNKQGIITESRSKQCISDIQHCFACCTALTREICAFRYEIIFKTIWQHLIHWFIQQLRTFNSSDITHCGETVHVKRSLFFYRMFTLHIQFESHLITVIIRQILIKRFIVACNTSSYTRSMGSKNSSYLWQFMVNIKQAETSHPLVPMIDNSRSRLFSVFRIAQIVIVETFHHPCCS